MEHCNDSSRGSSAEQAAAVKASKIYPVACHMFRGMGARLREWAIGIHMASKQTDCLGLEFATHDLIPTKASGPRIA
jgi:hypothetical protein